MNLNPHLFKDEKDRLCLPDTVAREFEEALADYSFRKSKRNCLLVAFFKLGSLAKKLWTGIGPTRIKNI